jgi:hypothetical protein
VKCFEPLKIMGENSLYVIVHPLNRKLGDNAFIEEKSNISLYNEDLG